MGSMVTMSSADLVAMFEDSHNNIGRMLLGEQNSALDRKFKKLEASQARNLDGKFKMLKQESQKDINDNISERLTATENRLQTMVNNANTMAEEAKSAVEKATMSTGDGHGGAGDTTTSGGARESYNVDGWVPRTLELKGYCTYGERYNKGISSEYASKYMEKLRKDLTSDEADNINSERTLAANRYAYDFKMVIVVVDQDNDQAAKDMAYKLKEALARLLTKPDCHIHKTQCYLASQASPGRRALFQLVGRFSGIFAELSGDDKLQAKREYGHDNWTILGWSVNDASGDKNSRRWQVATGGRMGSANPVET